MPAVSETVRVAARAPDVVGLNATVTVQLADAARLAPQVLAEMVKSPEFVPVMDTLLIVIEVVPPFFRVAVCDALVEPTVTVPYARLVGLNVTAPVVLAPVPERETVCGLFGAVSAKFREAARTPDAVGLNTIVTVQLAEAARLEPHVLAEILKSPAFVPVMATLLMVMDVLPRFFSVAD